MMLKYVYIAFQNTVYVQDCDENRRVGQLIVIGDDPPRQSAFHSLTKLSKNSAQVRLTYALQRATYALQRATSSSTARHSFTTASVPVYTASLYVDVF